MKYMPYSVTKVNNKIHYVVLVESGGRHDVGKVVKIFWFRISDINVSLRFFLSTKIFLSN